MRHVNIIEMMGALQHTGHRRGCSVPLKV